MKETTKIPMVELEYPTEVKYEIMADDEPLKFENVPEHVSAIFDMKPPTKELKFKEDEYISEIWNYITATYNQHYAKEQIQSIEFIDDAGHGVGFCIGDIIKYAQRYGKKGTPDEYRKDIMKIIHYAVLLLYIHDKENRK